MDDTIKGTIRRFVVTMLISLVMYFVQFAVHYYAENGSFPSFSRLMSQNPRGEGYTTHEEEILGNVVRPESIKERLDDIGGLKSVKEDIRAQVLVPLKHADVFFGEIASLHPPRGVLFYGPPGTGKTMLARAIAAEAGCPFVALSLSSLENKWFGETSKLLGATFSLARKLQPCVLFFDEIDGMIRTRGDNDMSAVYGFKTEFLSHMDGIRTNQQDAFIVIACTNCEKSLDPAIQRRLPQKYKIDYPDRNELKSILNVHLKNSGLKQKAIDAFAETIRDGATGSDIHELVKATWASQRKKMMMSEKFVEKLAAGMVDADTIARKTGRMRLKSLMQTASERGLLSVSVSG